MLKFVETMLRVNDPGEKLSRELQKEVKAGVKLVQVPLYIIYIWMDGWMDIGLRLCILNQIGGKGGH